MTRLRITALLALVSVCFGGIAPAQAQGQAQDKCSINPNLCMTEPVATSCPGGYKWSLAGTGIAHCVPNTPPPAPLPPPPPPQAPPPPPAPMPCTSIGASETGSCQPGYSGSATRATSTDTCTGAITYGAWDYSACIASCSITSSTEYAACQAPYVGQRWRTVTANSCTGNTYSAWDTTSCLVGQLPPPAATCPAIGDWMGSFTTAYKPKNGSKVLNDIYGTIFVGCYMPDFDGVDGQTVSIPCGYRFEPGMQDPQIPAGPPPQNYFKVEYNKISKCTAGAWTP
jgi:hypothetical protein